MAITENVQAQGKIFPRMDHRGRIDSVRSRLEEASLDALVVSNLVNVRYLCGFSGSAGMLLVSADQIAFVTDGRYQEQSAKELEAAGVDAQIEIISAEPDRAIARRARDAGAHRLGLEENHITWADFTRWNDTLFSDGELCRSESLVENLRMVKEDAEAVRIRAACEIADRALAETLPLMEDGVTEERFAAELESAMKRLGADDLSFATIVASGPNGALPHHHPGERAIARGDLVVVDFGALVDGYHSDMTRTFAVGELNEQRQRMFEVVLASQQAGMEAVRAGASGKDVDSTCRAVIADAGWGDAFVHGTGHGVGLDIHEEPRVSSRSTAILEAGHIVTVEPGVYLPELGGVRIEDTVLVTDTGCDRLTRAPKDPNPVS